MKKLLNSKAIAIMLITIMTLLLCSNTLNVVFANNTGGIQLNGMSTSNAGWAEYNDNNGNMIARVTGLEGFINNDVGTIVQSGNQNKYEWQNLAAGTYTFKVEYSSEYTLNVSVGGSSAVLTPVQNEENLYTFNVTVNNSIVMVDLDLRQAGDPQNPGQPGDPQNPGTSNVTLDFQQATLVNGTAVYTVDNKTVSVKLVIKDNDTDQYQDVAITDMHNTPVDLTANDYYLHIDKTNNNNVQVRILGTAFEIPGDSYLGLHPSDFQNNVLTISIESQVGPVGPVGPAPFENYEIIAKFSGVTTGVISDLDGNILMPEEWTEGEVEFYARTCTVEGILTPYHNDMTMYDQNSYKELRLDIEGIINRDNINCSVDIRGEKGDETDPNGTQVAVFEEDFLNYGRAGFHLCRYNSTINQSLNIVTENMIFVRAEAELGMTYSFGSATIDNAILTNRESGDVSIFFGNTETTIRVEGLNIRGITNVVGGESVVINQDGTATVALPPLSKETTTTLTVTIALQDGTPITKTINVRRTAIELGVNRANGNVTLEAGYVMHKAYLYNNQNHNDEIFDAYLQVILYKDGVVAGYKQVQINDEEFINNLETNESDSMELHSNSRIQLYGSDLGDTIEGVNSASVFLTNGPIDFSSDTLPSVEFGIGSGVTIDFGGEV